MQMWACTLPLKAGSDHLLVVPSVEGRQGNDTGWVHRVSWEFDQMSDHFAIIHPQQEHALSSNG